MNTTEKNIYLIKEATFKNVDKDFTHKALFINYFVTQPREE